MKLMRLLKKILSHSGIIGIHDLVIHHYGNCTTFATVHAEVPSDEDIVTSHDIIDNIEREFRNELGIDLNKITWHRCVDMNDRQLRFITDGQGRQIEWSRKTR